jgi:hypothetical protein
MVTICMYYTIINQLVFVIKMQYWFYDKIFFNYYFDTFHSFIAHPPVFVNGPIQKAFQFN